MQRRLRLLVNLSRMDDSHLPEQFLVCAPVGGSHAVGGQKYQWNDIVSRDLTTNGLSKGWRERAPSQDTVRWETKREVEAINVQVEREEKEHNYRRKRLRERKQADTEAGVNSNHPGCSTEQ